jgi:hypothetical protein
MVCDATSGVVIMAVFLSAIILTATVIFWL